MLSPSQYQEAKKAVEGADAYFAKHCTTGRGGWRSLDTKAHPDHKDANKERGEVEAYDFKHKDTGADGSYFAYYNGNAAQHLITTWMGDTLARVTWRGMPYRAGFGGTRINFRALGIDGKTYAGTYFTSSGNYVRMKRIKE